MRIRGAPVSMAIIALVSASGCATGGRIWNPPVPVFETAAEIPCEWEKVGDVEATVDGMTDRDTEAMIRYELALLAVEVGGEAVIVDGERAIEFGERRAGGDERRIRQGGSAIRFTSECPEAEPGGAKGS